MSREWLYIDAYDRLPECASVHCDTRDFHILVSNDVGSCFLETLKSIATEDNMFDRREILGYLKTWEHTSGGEGKWRHLSFMNDMVGWRKYMRFYRIGGHKLFGDKEDVGVYVGISGGSIHDDEIYTTEDLKPYLLSRTKHNPDNIKLNKDVLNFMKCM